MQSQSASLEPSAIHYETFPPARVRQEFLNHVRTTGSPETFPGLAVDEPPDELKGSQVISNFDVDKNKRPNGAGDRIFCARCGCPKFLKGALIWSPDGYARLIGHDCASRHFGDTYSSMMQEHDEKIQFERDQDFLVNFHAEIPLFCAEMANLKKPSWRSL